MGVAKGDQDYLLILLKPVNDLLAPYLVIKTLYRVGNLESLVELKVLLLRKQIKV
jgi:hypothetical protein